MKIFKKNEGITLIALVITIIVMLILVGVTLNMINGENGILGKAEKAVNETSEASIKEDIELAIAEKMLEYYEDYSDLVEKFPKDMDYVKDQFNGGIQTNSDAILKYNKESEKFEYTKDGQMANVDVDEEGHASIGDLVEIPVTPVAKYTVTYDANGGTCSTSSKSVAYQSNYGELPIPTRANCDFVGWYTNKKISLGTKIEDNSDFTLSSDQTLYAVWSHTHTASGTLVSGIALADDAEYDTSSGCYTSANSYTEICNGTSFKFISRSRW